MPLATLIDNLPWSTAIFFVLDWLIRIGLSLRVIMSRRGVGESLSWLGIILVLPFVGAIIYLILGENRLGRTRIKRAAACHNVYRDWLNSLSAPHPIDWAKLPSIHSSIDRQAFQAAGIPTLPGNRLSLLTTAQEALQDIIQSINAAEHHCHLEFYIWFEGGTADEVAQALIHATERGVECRVLVDSVGSKAFLKSDLAWRMRDAGVHIVECLPVNLFRALFRRIDLRNHRKLIVVDGHIAYTGSLNMIDPRYFKKHAGVGVWIDAVVRIEGEAVKPLAATFLEDWEIETGQELMDFKDQAQQYRERELTPPPLDDPDEHDPRSMVQVVPSGPYFSAQSIHQLLLTAIYASRDRLILTTPYFVPDESLLIALTSAAARGVDTTIIVPAENDSFFARHASHAYYKDLLDAGITIARFRDGLIHTKSVTVDDLLTVFGTVNLDMRSFYLNFELSLLIYDDDFTQRTRRLQQSYLARSSPVDLSEWEKRPFRQQFIENTTRLLGPLL